MSKPNLSNPADLAADPAKSLPQAFVISAPFMMCVSVIASLPWVAG